MGAHLEATDEGGESVLCLEGLHVESGDEVDDANGASDELKRYYNSSSRSSPNFTATPVSIISLQDVWI